MLSLRGGHRQCNGLHLLEAGLSAISSERDGLAPAPRLRVTIALSLATAMTVVAQHIVNAGLPQIAIDFAASNAEAVAIVTSYQLTLAVLVLPLAKLGERVGFRAIFLGGVAVLVGASIGCALARDLLTLVVLRGVQGAGAAGVLGVTAALYRLTFPSARFGEGLAVHAATVAVSQVLGPGLAGGVLALAGWPWLFLIFVPLGLAAVLVGARDLPHNAEGAAASLPSALLFGLAWCLFLIAFVSISHGESPVIVAAQALGAIALGWIYLRRDGGRGDGAFLPLGLFRRCEFSAPMLASALNFIAQMMVIVGAPFLLRDVYALAPASIALAMLGWALASLAAVPVVQTVGRGLPLAPFSAAGVAIATVAIGLMGAAAWPLEAVVGLLCACGFGLSMFHIPNNRMIMMSAPDAQIGAASGLIGAVRLGGQTIGAAFAALCFASGASPRTAILIAAAFCALAVVASLICRRGAAPG
ncbi:MAG: MFS transporter [Hyphomonadaceae bacterium]|nr:MFS transporter [Hyphomonadaceae bacterium]